jgi:aryl-alcohol dehydrogenase-like predicted oxidoreductase
MKSQRTRSDRNASPRNWAWLHGAIRILWSADGSKNAIKLLHAAIELGVQHFDTAELYGMGANETLLGEAFHDRRDKVFIATKFGPLRDPETGAARWNRWLTRQLPTRGGGLA